MTQPQELPEISQELKKEIAKYRSFPRRLMASTVRSKPPLVRNGLIYLVGALSVAYLGGYAYWLSTRRTPGKTFTPEWKKAEIAFMRHNNMNPISGVSSK
mmetsp:Transcript_9575/g.14416  ORF Transcript_9575/g.14416 Transcript_9575/m.14416 type:complete len:100 (+) Transcript_9575:112-411(+)|eukprot:CAMPEP_0185022508 /NCGR_PEP_ID=MMETSP1103-20130426/5213_1 /TAXON_ID=36769 /ORGANISM="Paraphysomonas bandaiensis, Strain Caron Lab Isolate" /LENGTH=99 /DNA_ID=CAMNT_0027554605 /DNA_START=100 /DNA_END=399 /DNA_ORIENTATION=-